LPTINLGILAHVDAGKTSLTERLLYETGVIRTLGRVDHGDTRTDTLALERERGITIKAAVTSFVIPSPGRIGPSSADEHDPTTVNLIDTPGHPDFIAEVERVLDVLDGIVLVVSAVEGVQAQTRILTRAVQRLGLPMLIFVNKIDRPGARPDAVLEDLHRLLHLDVLAMGRTADAETTSATFIPYVATDPRYRDRLIDAVTLHDDQLLEHYVEVGELSSGRIQRAVAEQVSAAALHPVYFGSAITGAGVVDVLAGIARLLPTADPRNSGPAAGVIFKIDRAPSGEKIGYLRVTAGTLAVRDQVMITGSPRPARITALRVFTDGRDISASEVAAGRIAKVWGLGTARIGDRVGPAAGERQQADHDHYFRPPSLETVVSPADPAQAARLRTALDQLAEQDPLINVRQDEVRSELSVSLYGEVQKEVIGATLESDFGVAVTFAETSTICVERPAGTGAAVEFMADPGNPFLATIGLRVDPAPPGSGISFGMQTAVHGTMPVAFSKAIEETVRRTAAEALHGWQLIDTAVTLTHTGYAPRQSHMHQSFNKAMSSTGSDFRDLTPLVLMAALRDAGTVVLEPIHHFVLDFPSDLLAVIFPVLADRRAVPGTGMVTGSTTRVEGDLPAAEIHALEQALPGLTRGEGMLEAVFDRYQPVVGQVPQRARTDRNPLDRTEYLLRCTRGRGTLS
jgi:ribosomal protection tetracycline resistance protein